MSGTSVTLCLLYAKWMDLSFSRIGFHCVTIETGSSPPFSKRVHSSPTQRITGKLVSAWSWSLVKAKFSVCTPWLHIGGLEVKLNSFLTTILEIGKWLASRGCFAPGGVADTYSVRGWLGSRVDVDTLEKIKSLAIAAIELDSSVLEPIAWSLHRRYPYEIGRWLPSNADVKGVCRD
jgi:hypothetical protein